MSLDAVDRAVGAVVKMLEIADDDELIAAETIGVDEVDVAAEMDAAELLAVFAEPGVTAAKLTLLAAEL